MYNKKVNDIIKFKNRCDYINALYNKYCFVDSLEKSIILFSNDPSSIINNILYVVGEINKIGYVISICNDYNELIINLENIKRFINSELNNYLMNETFEEVLRSNIKGMFKIV